jgi:histidinol phosphatase-like PHP family hydrolase
MHVVFIKNNNIIAVYRKCRYRQHTDYQQYTSNKNNDLAIPIIKNDNQERRFNAQVIYPIISQGDVIGSVVLISKDNKKKMTETEEKVAHIICKSAEKYQIPLEINLTEPCLYLLGERLSISYPSKEFWQIASMYDIKVLYGIDAHFKDQIEMYKESVKFTNEYIGKNVINKIKFLKK